VYSQNDEERVILEHLPNSGRFLDIGAFDGKHNSNTYALAEIGWCGVCVEPSPVPASRLLDRYKANPKIEVATFAVSNVAGIVDWNDAGGDQISTVSPQHVDLWRDQSHYTPMHMAAVTPAQLLDAVGDDFGFVSIDVEGINLEVAHAMPWGRLAECTLACVEMPPHPELLDAIMERYGFKRIHTTSENGIYQREAL